MQRKKKWTQKHDIAKRRKGGLKEMTTQRKKMRTKRLDKAKKEKVSTKT
jgi:hypothetical protein